MSFSSDWLALREPADHASRDAGLLADAAACVGKGGQVIDLGSGTGSTARAFARAGFNALQWRLLDGDEKLLEIAQAQHPNAACERFDLVNIASLDLDGAALVTASALLDLMSRGWIADLASKVTAAGVPFYAAINYNGVMTWTPENPQDAIVTAAFNAHQRTDKGLGPALGGHSTSETAQIFTALGYQVKTGDSPWQLGPAQSDLQEELIAGIADAAAETGCAIAQEWAAFRKSNLNSAECLVGHTDIFALPPPLQSGAA